MATFNNCGMRHAAAQQYGAKNAVTPRSLQAGMGVRVAPGPRAPRMT